MVRVPGGSVSIDIAGFEGLQPIRLEDYLIDRFEVTNKEFKRFVDSGGYQNPQYWKHEFVKNERVMSWKEGMAEFRDRAGRPGPSTWELGTTQRPRRLSGNGSELVRGSGVRRIRGQSLAYGSPLG